MRFIGVPIEHKALNIVARKGKKKVHYQKQSQIIVVGCVSATGNAIQPMVIFAAKMINVEWCKGEVPSSVGSNFEVVWPIKQRHNYRGSSGA